MPPKGDVEVVGHDLGASPRRLDGSREDLEEFLRVDGAVVLLGQIQPELGGPVDPPQGRRESPAAGPVWVVPLRVGEPDEVC